jgi:hypothetical protein
MSRIRIPSSLLLPVVAFSGSLVLLAAAAAPGFAEDTTQQQAAAVQAACSRVMRLSPGQAEFRGCIEILSDELAGEMRYARAEQADQSCIRDGLKRGTADFGRCVLDAEDGIRAQLPALDAAAVRPADESPASYYETSFALRHKREQYACAAIALEPSSGPFESCVTDLDSNLWNIAHPQD